MQGMFKDELELGAINGVARERILPKRSHRNLSSKAKLWLRKMLFARVHMR